MPTPSQTDACGFRPRAGANATAPAGPRGCPEGLGECLFEGVVPMDYMIYFNFLGCVLPPLLLMLVIYVHIFLAARRQLLRTGPKVAPAPPPAGPAAPRAPSTLRKEVHAAQSLAIIVGVFALCWLPLHLINCFNYLCRGCQRTHVWLLNAAIVLSHANSVVNPFVYAYRIREFRRTFRRILLWHILGREDGAQSGPRSGPDPGATCSAPPSPSGTRGSWCSTVASSSPPDAASDRVAAVEPGRTPAGDAPPHQQLTAEGAEPSSDLQETGEGAGPGSDLQEGAEPGSDLQEGAARMRCRPKV